MIVAEKSDIYSSEGVPDWLAKYVALAREAAERGEALPLDIEDVAQRAGVPGPDTEPAPKAKGVTPRHGKKGTRYEVRHKGKTIGTRDTFEEAVELKKMAEAEET